jgi:hypothetical protein
MFSTLPMMESGIVIVADVPIGTRTVHFWPMSRRLQLERARYSSNRHIDCSLAHLSNKHAFFNTIIYLCYASSFNPCHWHVVAVCTLEFLILRGQSQATLELRACVCLGYLP